MKKYTYKKLESCGRVFFRILTNCHGGYWGMAPGTCDYDLEEDAKRKVSELEEAELQSLLNSIVGATGEVLKKPA